MTFQRQEEAYQKSRLGRILVNKGYVSESELDKAIVEQQTSGKRLGEVLVDTGIVSRWQLRRALSRQTRLRFAASLAVALLNPIQLVHGDSTTAEFETPYADSDMNEWEDGPLLPEQKLARSKVEENLAHDETSIRVASQLVKMVMPVLNQLESGYHTPEGERKHDIDYDVDDAKAEIHPDGRIRLSIPSTVGMLRFDNIRLSGVAAYNGGAISLSEVDLSESAFSIRER
ncbi:hypothetical protein ACWJJH_12305 [Endozoicomonadaceae bacterium StTr2]